ncbi:hypothetical protein [Xanthobacter sp. KR7-225]|uniref:hypothetical protein n=1 Tax=Xanthobacter sp. KR7-225 TaxID=3156613 RepID=UPI0032B438AA
MRGAVGVALAYALVFQLVFAGALAERMAFADPAGETLCLASADGAPSGGAEKGRPAHLAVCAVCALAALTPPLPERAAAAAEPAFHRTRAGVPPRADAARHDPARHDPRTSQGPPLSA